MGQLNPFRFIETYGDVFRFVDEMLLLREEPTDMREYEADAALLASLVGIVFEVHGPVSYTHLDVYKRQASICSTSKPAMPSRRR